MPYYSEKVTLDALKARGDQVIEGLGDYEIDYNEKIVKIKVKSEDGIKTVTYSISIKREATTKLKSCEIEGQNFSSVFDKDTLNYDFEVTSGVINLNITAIPYDDDARVSIKGAGYIKEGKNNVTITVSKAGLEDTVYTIVVTKPESIYGQEYEYNYTGDVQTFVAPYKGYYQFELWGASGGYSRAQGRAGPNGGKGGYTTGKIVLNKGDTLYIYIGGHGKDAIVGKDSTSGWNGGGLGTWDYSDDESCGAGGGATDIRIVNGNWNDFNSLKSRIMVAAGGGGSCWTTAGGAGGGLNGIAGPRSTAATQTSGYAFGIGQSGSGAGSDNNGTAGAGGGYYGGYTDLTGSDYGSSAGGSSFISGYDGCDAISEESTSDNIIHTGQSIHYSGMKFTKAEMVAGNQTMPTHDGEDVMTGNSGNGYAKITLLKDPSQNNLLKELQISYDETKHTMPVGTQDILDKAFSYDDNEYTVKVGPEDTSFTIYGVQDDATATVEGNGTYDIPAGTTPIKLTVTSESGDVRTYTINVVREASSNSTPTNIQIDGLIESMLSFKPDVYGVLTNTATGEKTEFNPEVYDYTMVVPARIKELTFNVTKGHAYQVVENDGLHKLDAEDGKNTIAINIKSEDGSTTKTYTYHINRDMDSNCLLKSLNVTNLTPEDWPGVITEKQDIDFDQNTLEYYLIVPNEVTKLDVSAVAEDEQVTPIIKGADSLKVGLNNIYVIVNARNGEQLVYIIHCYRMMSGNTFLSDLNVKSVDGATQYTLEPTFNKILDTYEVTEIVPNDTKQVVINATPEVTTTTVSGTGTVDLKTGVNVFKITAKAEDGSIGTYNLSIERAKSSNNYLSALSASEGKFVDQMETDDDGNPKEKAFDKETSEYYINVGSDVNYLTLAYTKEDETATVEVTGNSGFKAGDNMVTITVTAENGDKREYKITVNKARSTNCYLSSLSTSSGELSPEFNKETESYTVEVENEIEDITVNATTEDSRSTLTGTGKYALAVGENSVNIVVTAENEDTKTYTLKIIRKLNSNKNLLNVEGTYKVTTEENGEIVSQENKTVKATKSTDGLTYTINVPNEISKINITGTPEVAKTTVTGNGKKEITVGENKFTLTLTAEDGGAKDYTVIVNRAKSNNCNLKYLFVNESNYSPKLTADQTTYATTVLAGTTSLTMKIKTEDEGATYVVSGNENFTEGENDVKITVTASDGVTQKVYTIKVFVQSNNTESNYLSSLILDPGTLNPEFDKDTLVYNVELPYETTKTTVSAIAESSLATVEGTGDYDLQVGENDIAVVVTSGDGIKRTYQVKVTRKQSTEARLSKLEIANHTFTPEFDKDTTTYYLDTTLDQLSISAETLSKNASYEIIGNENFVKGTNNVIIRVTAPDGVTTKDYTLVVTKTASPNYYLSDLKVVGYSLSPEFNKQTSSYTVNVPSNVYKVEVRATPEDKMATVEGTGLVSLNPGKNVQNVTVTSESGKVKTYTITINKGLSDDNYLKELSVSKGKLTPEFNKDTLEYNVTLDYEDSTEDIIAYANDYRATISGDGNKELKVGDNKFNVVVTAEDGTTRTYTINVTRKPAISALLENLAVTNYSINPTFASSTKDYSVTVDNEIATVKDLGLKIETLDPKATYKLKYNDSEISINDETELIVGINTLTIEVTSSDGVTKENYTLNVKRQVESNNYLVYIQPSVGTLTPVFSKKTMNYTMTVDSNVEKITFSAEPEAQDSTVEGITDDSGNKVEYSLNKGENEIPITVTSSLGIKRTYKIVVTRKKNSNNYLSTLKVKKGSNEMEISPIFDKNTQEYTVDGIPVGTSVIQILGTTEDELATISGSGYISLTSATTKQNVIVTAEDGTQRTYTLTLNREKSSEANLTDLVPSVGTLNPTFVYGTTEYSLELGNTDNYLSFDAETLDKNATVIGAESEAVPNGTSKRIITVTAEDGTQITYTVNVNRVRTDDASLKELTLADGWSLTPEFSESNYNYTIEVPNSVTKFESSNVTSAVPKYDTSTVTIDGDMELSTKNTNVFNIKVLAADGFTTQTYKINITRAKSDNSNVTNIVPKIVGIDSNGNREEARTETLNPTFDKDVSQYTLTVGNEDYYISFDVTTEDENAVITGAEEQSIEDGTNKYTITITSEDGTTTQTYTINVIKNRTNYAKLKSLAVKNYTLDQEFDPEVTEYTLTVPNDKFEITENEIVAKAMYDGSTIEYNGTVELSTIELNTYEVKVTSPDGTASRTYTLKITRKKSSDSTLKSLSATGYKFDKTFASGTTDYICYVPKGTETFETSKVTAVPTDKYATIEMSGDLDRTKGENTFKINVTSQDETTQTTYTLKVEDEKSNDGDLKSLSVTGGTMSPEFDKLTRTYTVNMTNKQKELTIQAEPEDSSAVILEGTGTFEITDAETEHMIIIEAEDGSKTIYILNITKDMTPVTTISGTITTENTNKKYIATIKLYKAGTEETETTGTNTTETGATETTALKEVETGEDGKYEFDVEAGTYDVVIEKAGYLKYTLKNIEIAEGDKIDLGENQLIAGDINGDGEIEISDLVGLNDNVGTTITDDDKSQKSIYDLNEDGTIDKLDRNILKKNYGKKAKTVKWVNPEVGLIKPITTEYVITSKYGMRKNPVTGETKLHSGIDIVGEHHTPIIAVADGEVTYAGVQNGYGNCVEIKHTVNGKTLYSFYGHLSRIDVKVGDTVTKAQTIGLEGGASTDENHGTSTGHHLHFEIRTASGSGNSVNPTDYIEF